MIIKNIDKKTFGGNYEGYYGTVMPSDELSVLMKKKLDSFRKDLELKIRIFFFTALAIRSWNNYPNFLNFKVTDVIKCGFNIQRNKNSFCTRPPLHFAQHYSRPDVCSRHTSLRDHIWSHVELFGKTLK